MTERYADVAHGRGQGCGEIPRRLGTAIARGQLCGNPFDFSGNQYFLLTPYNALIINRIP
jgi:hypothetical protein